MRWCKFNTHFRKNIIAAYYKPLAARVHSCERSFLFSHPAVAAGSFRAGFCLILWHSTFRLTIEDATNALVPYLAVVFYTFSISKSLSVEMKTLIIFPLPSIFAPIEFFPIVTLPVAITTQLSPPIAFPSFAIIALE